MSLVATLVSSRANPQVTNARVRAAADAVAAVSVRELATNVAADIVLGPDADPLLAETALRKTLADAAIDVVVQPAAGRRKRLLIADMDSTMIGQECIDELAAEVGLKDHVAAITERAMRGEIAFEPALRERVALLKDLPLAAVERVIATRITLTPGGPELVGTMRAKGGYAALVSGGFTVFTGPIAARIGFDENRANVLLVRDGVLLGTVEEPILGQQAKLDALEDLIARLGLDPAETLAVGDGANDLAMIRAAGLGVAFHAKPRVAAEAAARIDHADLAALLFIQGYSEDEIAAG